LNSKESALEDQGMPRLATIKTQFFRGRTAQRRNLTLLASIVLVNTQKFIDLLAARLNRSSVEKANVLSMRFAIALVHDEGSFDSPALWRILKLKNPPAAAATTSFRLTANLA